MSIKLLHKQRGWITLTQGLRSLELLLLLLNSVEANKMCQSVEIGLSRITSHEEGERSLTTYGKPLVGCFTAVKVRLIYIETWRKASQSPKLNFKTKQHKISSIIQIYHVGVLLTVGVNRD